MALVATSDTATTPLNTPVTVPVLANDTLDGAPVQLADLAGPPTITVVPTHGTAVVETNGSVTYTPATGFSGADSLTYQIQTPGDMVLPTASIVLTCGSDSVSLSLIHI